MAKKDRVRERLRRAQTADELVRIRRSIKGADDIEGYVVDLGTRWALVAVLDSGICLDGFIAIRVKDIAKIRRRASARFVQRALELHGAWPPAHPPAAIPLEKTRPLIESCATAFPLVTLHLERDDPTVCYIGVPIAWRKKSIELLDVTPDAAWDGAPRVWRIGAVTRVYRRGAL